MKIERMEVVGINVTDLDAAMSKFSDLLGVDFTAFAFGKDVEVESFDTDVADAATASFAGTRIAIDPTGYLELVEVPAGTAEGFRNMHFKVTDLDEAKAELRARGSGWSSTTGSVVCGRPSSTPTTSTASGSASSSTTHPR